jgi:phosphohistidine phosphatase
MKQLVIMRHAKAEKAPAGGEDFDRPLAGRGREEAVSVARALMAYGVRPDFALVSSARRTLETFRQVESVLGEIPALISEDLYNAGADKLLHAIEAHEEDGQCVLVVAHNPGVQYLVADYLFAGAASPDIVAKVQSGYPTATATVFEVDVAGRPLYDGIYLAESSRV